jgi:hypothetical protein
VRREEHWQWRAQAITAIVPCFERLLYGKTHYERFLNLCRLRGNPLDRKAIQMGIHLLVANCMNSATGWLTPENWHDLFGWEQPAGFNFNLYQRFMVFSKGVGHAPLLLFGQEPRKRNYVLVDGQGSMQPWKASNITSTIVHLCNIDDNYAECIVSWSLKDDWPELF